MVKREKIMRIGAIGLLSIGAISTMAMGNSSQAITMNAIVPLVCNVGFEAGNAQYNDSGVAELGATREFCNSGNGYKVYARTTGTDSGASLVVGSSRYEITNGSEILIADLSGPAKTSRQIYLDAGEGNGGGSLSLRIEAK
ncbi:MAG: hypothetical protein J0L55_15840 [Caulobacterales bacterium]|nr:hypothetical protein [Caulobacterales bacterium]